MRFECADDSYTVFFEGWHEEFDDSEEALNCLAFGLSKDCRLKEHSRGSTPYKWTVEYLDGDNWEESSTTGTFFFPFWKSKKMRYLQNNLIDRR